jgi:uncharacterized protein YecT (DUF1311 family)
MQRIQFQELQARILLSKTTLMRTACFAILYLLCEGAHAAPAWDWSEPVRYRENHDPSVVTLSDGRELMVDYSGSSVDDMDKWPQDKPLLLGYRRGHGVVLSDPDTGKSMQVLHGLEDKHPIDLLIKRCLDKDESTPGREACYADGREQWDAELNRAYKVLIDAVGEQHRAALRGAQQQWLKFRDAELAAINAVYDREGTLWRVVTARRQMELSRERALRLGSLYEGW